MKEGVQGMEIIEKTRWEGDKTVGVESEKKDERSVIRSIRTAENR